ncbi:16S rRNA (cytidine(1402)-2'-O)-methyltransferase [Candidatus Parcubacteria bacterium]|nr:16S rRNA (cytidine(1402)-2'-O)-methyltransferase [Candidatus Parcubacteria bacterium]
MGTLSVVATPIGNLGDITLRALETLKAADVIFCEDTRVTAKLLAKYEITKPLMRADANKEDVAADTIITLLGEEKHVALVTDAGTPGISDPGARIVSSVRQAMSDIRIEAIPGPSALTAALSIAGIPATEFVFLGFLPHKKGRQTLFKEIAAETRTVVLYESPHRILKTLASLAEYVPERRIGIARELTKMHESFVEGTGSELLAYFNDHPDEVRGEFVVIVHP